MINIKSSKKLVPRQEEGSHSDTSHLIKMKTVEEAKALFSMAKNRLLDIPHWHKLCGVVTGKFYLTDDDGNELKGLAIPGDYLKIDIPGLGTKTGSGYDWVKIENIEENRPDADSEEIAIKVRPAQNPVNKKDDSTAHFFKNKATSTFIVKREKNVVLAEVHGRNELANLDIKKPLDKIRNALMAVSAMLGFSSSQWKKLVRGLLSLKKLR